MRCLHESGFTCAPAGPRRRVPDLGPHRDRDHWCAPGSPRLPRRGSSCQRRAWPGAGGRGTDRVWRPHAHRTARAAMGFHRPP